MLHNPQHGGEPNNVVRLHPAAPAEAPGSDRASAIDACDAGYLTRPGAVVGRREGLPDVDDPLDDEDPRDEGPRDEGALEEGQTDVVIREACIRLLMRREHTRVELTRWLLARGYAEHVVEVALQRLVDDGLQSDRRFAEAFVRGRVGRGQGPILIRAELQARGIDEELSAPLLGLDDEDWRRQAASALRRQYHGALPRSCSERAKHARFLLRRGFPKAVVGRVLASL